jgi:hypothetical protein
MAVGTGGRALELGPGKLPLGLVDGGSGAFGEGKRRMGMDVDDVEAPIAIVGRKILFE